MNGPFQGFTKQTGELLWELSFNNERPWFLAHKEQFETLVDRPLRAMAAETLAELDRRAPDYGFETHVARVYRDARRLFGRGPYKDHLWFSLHAGDKHDQSPDFWFEIGPATVSYGLGWWEASPSMMDAFRRAVQANPARFERLTGGLEEKWKLWGEPYKRPKLQLGETLDPWVNRKGLSVGWERDFEGEFFDPALPRRMAERYERLLPLYDFLREAWRAAQEE